MSTRVAGLTRDILGRLPDATQQCVFWEADPVTRSRGVEPEQARQLKQEWLSRTLLEWGSCGQALLADGEVVAFATYAPHALVPSADSFATAPIGRDAVLLMTGWVDDRHRGLGLGRLLVQSVAKDVVRRRIRAVEAFATQDGRSRHQDCQTPCQLPADFLSSVGFETVRQHSVTPRMRLDLRSVASWRAEMEGAIDRLLGGLLTGSPTRG